MKILSLTVIVLGALAGMVFQPDPQSSKLRTNGSFAALRLPEPTNIATLVASADIIVEAEIGSFGSPTEFAGYNSQGTMIPVSTPSPGPFASTPGPGFGLVTTNLVVDNVSNTIRDCDGVVATPNAVIVRMPGVVPSGTAAVATDVASDYPMGAENSSFLFFLSRNPDSTYGLRHGPCSRLLLATEAACSDGSGTQLSFMSGVASTAFVNAVATEVTVQSCP